MIRYFYIAIAEQRTNVLEDVANLLSSYTTKLPLRLGILVRFTKWFTCQPCKIAEKYDIPLFVDNGAFDFLKGRLDNHLVYDVLLDKWVRRYVSWLQAWYNYVTAAALPDIPVHGRDFVGPQERLNRIRLTARLHDLAIKQLRRCEPWALAKSVPVIQGYELWEYQYAATLLPFHETATTVGDDYRGVVGVGSVCVRKPSAKGKTGVLASGVAAGTLRGFMREFLDAKWPREIRGFHFFGLHTEAVHAFAFHPRYFASDTGAHGLNFRWKWKTFLRCRQPDGECYLRSVEHQVRTSLSPLLHNRALTVFTS